LDYINDPSISEPVKLTKIGLEYDIWFKLFLAILTGYSVVAVSYYAKVPEFAGLMTETRYEHWNLFSSFVFAICLNTIVFLGTVCLEFIERIVSIKDAVGKIKKQDDVAQSEQPREIA
jgi:hypothetical protein